MKWLSLLPLLVCFFIAILTFLTWYHLKLQKILHFIGAIILLISTSILFYFVQRDNIVVVQVGGYPAPFGISFVIDRLSAIMLLITGTIALCTSIYAMDDIHQAHQKKGFFPVYWILLMGICGAFSTGDLFNLYVWFEVILIASFVLLALDNRKIQLDGTMKYVSLNLVATIIMLLAIGILYGMVGTLNLADLAVKLKIYPLTGTVTSVVLLLAIAYSIKAALFPLFFWLPASYHTANVTASAIFAGMLTKVGVYALIRLTTLILPHNHLILNLLLFSAGFTMLTGVLGAVSQYHFRRLLSFHIISQIGYTVMGLAIYTPFALASAIFFMAHNMVAKTNLFLVGGICGKLGQSADIRKLGNCYRQYPYVAICFFISAFSLAGIPPLSGFWGKFLLVKSAFITEHYYLAIISLLASLLTLYSMTKIWNQVFWKDIPDKEAAAEVPISNIKLVFYLSPIVILAVITFLIGIFPQVFFEILLKTAEQLFHPENYIHAVLGDKMR
ncbi:NADH/ubiquinone/plastoquinone [Legionella jamestowniensis]|uniref:NADH/ubiquinone/plastoquinone n=1 Tax=Legionella jamestowniensis TaxID=455 RepID=A0ABX2XWN3_9GAMM|nr:proton-conducting transporter membrane subunit [Legionella jamestowniensis]OCH98264.1 NADH/ubiquinone/plastoquinone [Legionella jamestowniensis]